MFIMNTNKHFLISLAAAALLAVVNPWASASAQDKPIIDFNDTATPSVEIPINTAPADSSEAKTQTTAPADKKKPAAPSQNMIDAEQATKVIENKATIVKVDAGENPRIFLDKGSLDGITVGMDLDVYMNDPVTDMKGTVLADDEVFVGRIRAVETKPKVTVCEAVTKGAYMRGNYAKYFTLSQTKPKKENRSVPGRCPSGMYYDSGGAFVFIPGTASQTGIVREIVDEADAFCIDPKQKQEVLTWTAAANECKLRKKRLCTKQELEKVCTTWDKPKPCPKDLRVKNQCPDQNTVIDLYRSQEWTSDPVTDEDGNVSYEANSCSCPGTSPVCTHCVYAGCRGAKKVFRCCSDPLEEETPPPLPEEKKK